MPAGTDNAVDHATTVEVVGGKDGTGEFLPDAACTGSLAGPVQGILVAKHDCLYPGLRCKFSDAFGVEMPGDEVGPERLGAFRRPMIPCGHRVDNVTSRWAGLRIRRARSTVEAATPRGWPARTQPDCAICARRRNATEAIG